MADVVVAVTFDGTRLSAAESDSDGGTWDKLGTTQSPTQDDNFVLQGSIEQSNKLSAAAGGVDFDFSALVDFETLPRAIIAKFQATTVAGIDRTVANGMAYRVGHDNSNYQEYDIVGSATDYPVSAGWIALPIDPNIAAHVNRTVGTVTKTAIDYIGLYIDMSGASRAENIIHSALDYVDVGAGLTLLGGGGAQVDGKFSDFVLEDEDTAAVAGIFDNRWRVASRSAGSDTVTDIVGVITIGDDGADATVFTDSNKVLKWAGGFVGAGFHGLNFALGNSGTAIDVSSCTFVSDGVKSTFDSRASVSTIDNLGSVTIRGGAFINFNEFDLRGNVTFEGTSFVEPESILLNGAALIGIIADSPTVANGVGFVNTKELGDITGGSEFTSSAVGHAVELTDLGTGSMPWDSIDSGYAAVDGSTGNETIYVNVASGVLTINVSPGASTPTVRTAGAVVTVVVNPVITKITVIDSTDKSAVQGAAVTIRAGDTVGGLPFEETVTITRVGSVATVAHTAHGLATGKKVEIEGAAENEYNRIKTITVTGVDAYTFAVLGTPATPATGAITSTALILDGLTDTLGEVEDTRTLSVDQAFTGSVKKGSGVPVFVSQDLADSIDKDNGFLQTVSLIPD